MDTVRIADETSEVVIVPELGAGIASYDHLVDGWMPLFRPCRDLERARPFDLASNLLVPWSGRISGGGFHFAEKFHGLAPNLASEPLPIHGIGFSSVWEVERMDGSHATLTLSSIGPGPYRFDARVVYALEKGALTTTLSVTNRADDTLPHGLGLHPWFPRTPDTTLRARAEIVTLEDSRHLPAGQLPVALRKDWDFSTPRGLPGAWINNDFLALGRPRRDRLAGQGAAPRRGHGPRPAPHDFHPLLPCIERRLLLLRAGHPSGRRA